ncbi:MAG: hypothetical protein JSU72_19485, partial [Deltaproteobacteria bacterium]
RNIADIETVLTRGATISSTLASFRPKERVKSGKRWVTPKTFVVEVIKGDKVTKMKFKHARRDTSHVNRKKAS